MEPVSLIAGGALVVVGFALGRINRRTKNGKPPPRPRCGCGHSIGYHDDLAGRCHGSDEDCTCRHYDGPQPLETFYSRELTDRGGDSRP